MFDGFTRCIHFNPPAFAQEFIPTPTDTSTGAHIIGETTNSLVNPDAVTTTGSSFEDNVAVGDGATIEGYVVDAVTGGTPGMANREYDEDGVANPAIAIRDVELFDGALYEATTTGVRGGFIITLANLKNEPEFDLFRLRQGGNPGTTTYTVAGSGSTAVGDDANIRGTDSVAVGHDAKVVREETTPITTSVSYTWDEDTTDSVALIEVSVNTNDEVFRVSDGTRLGTVLELQTDTQYANSHLAKMTDESEPVTRRVNVDRAVAVGASSEVELNNGVAIGAGARVLSEGPVPVAPGTPTHIYDPDGEGSMTSIPVEISDGILYAIGSEGVRGEPIGNLAELRSGSASFNLDTLPPRSTDIISTGGVAIGADVEVTGTGIAIGSDTTGVDAEGTITPAVATAADEIRIGNAETHTGAINIGDVDVRDINNRVTKTNVFIGAGATVLPAIGTATHTFDPDGAGTMIARDVEIFDDNLYETTTDGTRGVLIGTLADISSSPAFTLDLIVPDRENGGVAIGADAEATGEGIAIGKDTVAANDGITIGDEGHTGAINIGDVDVRAEQDRIATNVENILNNGANIKVNRDNIATNASDIDTNTKGIATAVAIAGLATGPGSGLSVGFGSFKSETAIAIGYDNTFGAEQNMSFKAAAASAGSGSTAGSLSMRWAF